MMAAHSSFAFHCEAWSAKRGRAEGEEDFQRESLRTTRCEERNGKFVVVFNQNGF
jgi:hypothetical protein